MIPNVFHFIYFFPESGKKEFEFSLAHYLCIKSALDVNKPEKIFFYLNYEPYGVYWEKIKPFLNLEKIKPPESIFGNKLYHPAHKSDVMRINILYESGGIYMDLDTICKKSFSPLLQHDFIMGKQGRWRNMGLCNGVIFAKKNAEFLDIWYKEYKTFRSEGHDKYWAEHSIERPFLLSKKYPDLIHVEPYNSFHYPLYYSFSLYKLFKRCIDYPNAFCHHLWEGASGEKYLKNLTVDYIKSIDTTYNIIARRFL
jgi:hypothetical protein